MYQIDPKVWEKRETNQGKIKHLIINNPIHNHSRKLTQMDKEIKPFNSKEWIDKMVDKNDTLDANLVEVSDTSREDLDIDYTHSQ